jgi:quercetin dioxygenase-like cupin family protein
MSQQILLTTAPVIVHADGGKVVDAFGSAIRFMLTAEHTAGTLTLGLATVPPGDGPPPHLHETEDELFVIVEGRYSLLAQGTWTEVGPGAVVYLPRGSVHTFRNIGDTPARHWVLTTPSGFESFYEKSAEVFAAPGAPDMGRLVDLAGQHGIRFV